MMNFYIAEGETVSEQFDDSDDAAAFLGGWDIEYAGLTDASTESIELDVIC